MIRAWIVLHMLSLSAAAQFTYTLDLSIPVEVSGRLLANPWAGGLNSAQLNTIDLNGDAKNDLVVFDRSSGTLSTFLQVNNSYQHAPDYARLFPKDIAHWMLLRDFNCDGKKDLFTSDPFGISVYVNTTAVGGKLRWRPFNGGTPLLTVGFSGNINLKVNESDLPAIDDIDGDGDLDILNVRFVGPGTVEWHKNLSKENTGQCDSMRFERITQTYGNFQECSCGIFAFGPNSCPTGGRVAHVGGKNMLTIDLDNDGDRELLFSEETCSRLYTLTNSGSPTAANFTGTAQFSYSTSSIPAFPAPYLEDVDFDGKQDLIISPNTYGRTFTNWLVNHSVFLFRNTGTAQAPAFGFIKDNFLQEDMIEVGDYSVPAFADFDGDGDEDMLIGFYAGQNFIGGIQLFENTGTRTLPAFRLFSSDYFGLSGRTSYNFKPQLVDMDRDGRIDVAFTATSLQNGVTTLQYLRNMNESGIGFHAASWIDTGFRIGVAENLSIVDINLDGKMDFLIGRGTGALEYWENNSGPYGGYGSMVKKSSAYLGLGTSTSRLNPVVAVGDLDADGRDDLILATHRGYLSIYSDFREFDPELSLPVESVIQNNVVDSTVSINLGGRIWPTIVNLFDNDKPAIVVGNTTGGLQILKHAEGQELSEEPQITIYPNPLAQGDTLKVVTDRPATMQVFSSLGQRMSDSMIIPANRSNGVPIKGLSSGMYIARFAIKEKYYSRRFIIY